MKSTLISLLLLISFSLSAQENFATKSGIAVSSLYNESKYPASMINDGVVSDASRWLSAKENPSTITFKLEQSYKLGGLHFYSGYGTQSGSPVKDFNVEFYANNQWNLIPSANITGNVRFGVVIKFDENTDVTTDSLRISITKTSDNLARVREVSIWEYSGEGIPEIGFGVEGYEKEIHDSDIPVIYINQSGYNLNKPKRFTAPTLADGTPFIIREVETTDALYNGVINDNKADFSDFNPNSSAEFEIVADTIVSFPFRIGHWWLERVSYQGMVDFMIDARHWTGNYTSTCHGSYGWRDDTHFGWELHTLVPQYLSHPEAYNRMPRQITYRSTTSSKWGALDVYNSDAPDMVKLIHWGADIVVSQGLKHENMKAQLAYFLYAWPWIKEWLPEQNYTVVKNFATDNWTEDITQDYAWDYETDHNLLALKTVMGTTKGERPPGRTVQPNLLMYKVALRDSLDSPEQYFDAAYNQVEWMIQNIDWEDSISTKGQRMSEFHTLVGLSHMYTQYPDRAPAGLKEKVEAWADVMIRRSDNMWDFRKLTDNGPWVPYNEEKPTHWNEPGNVMGFPACLKAACLVIEDEVKIQRMDKIAYSHLENTFGRNPCGRHFGYDGAKEIEGVEIGWYSKYYGGIGRLENSRFVFDGAPKYNHYPYHPEIGNVGWTEGWVQFNVAYNLSLAYMANSDISFDTTYQDEQYTLRLQVPHNFDYETVETITIIQRDADGEYELTLTEESENSSWFSAEVGALETETTFAYGYGFFEKSITINKDTETSLKSKTEENTWSLYPNPARGEVNISGLSSQTEYNIFSLSGQLKASGKTSGHITLDGIGIGLYIVQIDNTSLLLSVD